MIRYVITCEHASAKVPAAYRKAFAGAGDALSSHRGSDLGALQLARQIARQLQVPCISATTTRLLVDTNRSRHHRAVFSEWSTALPSADRESILATYWQPHRDRVRAAIQQHVGRGRTVVHLGVHSFTPVFRGTERAIDVAWLYDPTRTLEVQTVDAWRAALASCAPDLRLRRNAPYRGTSDGLTTFLRTQFPADQYLGIELEVNQSFPLGPMVAWRLLRQQLCESLRPGLATIT